MSEIFWNLPNTVGLAFLLVGLIFYIFPPKKINSAYGYRTRNSMKTIERWTFAQRHAARIMIISGIVLLITGFLAFIFNINQNLVKNFGLIELALLTLFLFFKTERDLNRKFGETL